jgi:hypothetical protein
MSVFNIPAPTVPLTSGKGVVDPQWYIFWANLFNLANAESTTLSLEQLSDVSVGSKVNGNVLVWNSAQQKWVPGSTAGLSVNGSPVSSLSVQGLLKFTPPNNLSGYLTNAQGTLVLPNVATQIFTGDGVTLSATGTDSSSYIEIPGVEYGTLQVQTIATGGLLSGALNSGNLTLSGALTLEQGTFFNSIVTSIALAGGGVSLSGTSTTGTLSVPGVTFSGTQVAGLAAGSGIGGNIAAGVLTLSSAISGTINSSLTTTGLTAIKVSTGNASTSASFSGTTLVLNLGTP